MATGKRFVVTHSSEDGETILAHDAASEDVFPAIVTDALASDILPNHDEETREAAVEMVARIHGFEEPRCDVEGAIYGRDYRVEELPDDPTALDEFYSTRLANPKLLKLVFRVPGKLRVEIWPNESQHRGRPHCRVSKPPKAASFTIPDGQLLVGDLRPDEREATKLVQSHGQQLLDLWNRMRPDDQKL